MASFEASHYRVDVHPASFEAVCLPSRIQRQLFEQSVNKLAREPTVRTIGGSVNKLVSYYRVGVLPASFKAIQTAGFEGETVWDANGAVIIYVFF